MESAFKSAYKESFLILSDIKWILSTSELTETLEATLISEQISIDKNFVHEMLHFFCRAIPKRHTLWTLPTFYTLDTWFHDQLYAHIFPSLRNALLSWIDRAEPPTNFIFSFCAETYQALALSSIGDLCR